MNASKKAAVVDGSPTKQGMNASLKRTQTKIPKKLGRSPTKRGDHHGEHKGDNKESGLASPTSVTM